MKKNELIKAFENADFITKSKINKAHQIDIIQMLEDLPGEEVPEDREELEKALLKGAKTWLDYSFGGCALISNEDICNHYCTASEIIRTRSGELKPRGFASLLTLQASQLRHAYLLIWNAVKSWNKSKTVYIY